MEVPRQEGSSTPAQDQGRVKQKRRTRAAIVDAAKELMERGITPTVTDAAEAADVSRTTAYRYFPTQESLLVEIALNVNVDDIEALLAEPVDAAGARDRVVAVMSSLNEHVLADEVRYRTALRLYLDMWLTAHASGDAKPVVREGRRRRWLNDSLAPLADRVSREELDRLVGALCLVTGAEAMIVLQDIGQTDERGATETALWAAQVLMDATFGD